MPRAAGCLSGSGLSTGCFCPSHGPLCSLAQLKKLYPDMPMELHLSARKQPLLTCRPDSLALALFGAAEAFVVLPNATLASAFLLDLVSTGHTPGPLLCPLTWHPGSLSPRGPGALVQGWHGPSSLA